MDEYRSETHLSKRATMRASTDMATGDKDMTAQRWKGEVQRRLIYEDTFDDDANQGRSSICTIWHGRHDLALAHAHTRPTPSLHGRASANNDLKKKKFSWRNFKGRI